MRAVLGRVAGVAKGVGGAVFGEAKAALTAAPDDAAEVEFQLQRVSDALMPEYRRDATVQLRELLTENPKAQLVVGELGIPVLVAVLREDRDDLELLRGALECLIAAMAQHLPPQPGVPPTQEAHAGAINAELFARKPEHVQLLLSLLEPEPVGISDFYVRYHTVQLLTLLLQACAYKLQDAILASPMGVVRLCELLGEGEVIRNEALQLLVALTQSNTEVQKIAAFEGAFDRIFTICRDEGGAGGGVVVQDCLQLLNNLLRGNQANQRLFKEMGFVPPLVALLAGAVPPGALDAAAGAAVTGRGSGMAAQLDTLASAAAAASGLRDPARHLLQVSSEQAGVLLCALESVMLLASGSCGAGDGATASADAAITAASHDALLAAGVVEALLPLCLVWGGVSSTAVRTQALQALATIVSGHVGSRDRLGAALVTVPAAGPPAPASPNQYNAPTGLSLGLALAATAASPPVAVPALLAGLRVALHAPNAKERAAAEQLLHAYCEANPDGQVALVCSIAPGAGDSPGGVGGRGVSAPAPSFGRELAAALVAGGASPSALQLSTRAASVLQHLLWGNATAKQRLLTIPLQLASAGTPVTELLLPRCMRYVSTSLKAGGEAGRATAVQLLRALVVWLHDCPLAARALLETAAHLPLLIDLVVGKHPESSTLTAGLAALLLGACFVYGGAGVGTDGSEDRRAVPSAGGPPAKQMVLDVVLSRVGLSAFFSRLDDLVSEPSFVAAATGRTLPQPVTRAAAAAATAMDELAQAEPGTPTTPGRRGGATQDAVAPFDAPFTALAQEMVAAIKAAAMAAFARPDADDGSGDPYQGLQKTSVEGVIAGLPGATDAAKLRAAVEALQRAAADAADARARNVALAQDLFRVAGDARGSNAAASASREGGHMAAPPLQPTLAAGAMSAADVEARVAAEMRASKAELELASVRRQLELLGARLAHAEQDAAASREAAAAAAAQAAKHEADLQDLTAAYNSLESQAFTMETRIRELTNQLSSRPAVGAGVPEAQVQARLDAAVAAAREAAAAESDEQMTDLLVCLGQEEQKVAVLKEQLAAYGVDVDALLDAIKPPDDGEEAGGGAGGEEEDEGLR